jgi:hypothetical protein
MLQAAGDKNNAEIDHGVYLPFRQDESGDFFHPGRWRLDIFPL